MESKVIRTTFYMGEFIEQEKWLELQHNEGWKFIRTDGKHYEFKKCEPEKWIYQLDFKENGIAEDDYLQLFSDCGWEFVQQFQKWFIFRKKKAEDEIDLSIFSDNESRIEMCKRVTKRRFLKLLPLLLAAAAWNYLLIFTDVLSGKLVLHSILAGVGTAAVIILVAAGFGQYYGQRRKINKAIEKLQNPMK